MSTEMRHALSEHDVTAPLSVEEMYALANQIENDLVNHEVQFSDPEWRYVDGLRALAHRTKARIDKGAD